MNTVPIHVKPWGLSRAPSRGRAISDADAVVLHINSPGGSPVQSQRVYDEIRYLQGQGDKPILAVIEDIGASGAYYSKRNTTDTTYAKDEGTNFDRQEQNARCFHSSQCEHAH